MLKRNGMLLDEGLVDEGTSRGWRGRSRRLRRVCRKTCVQPMQRIFKVLSANHYRQQNDRNKGGEVRWLRKDCCVSKTFERACSKAFMISGEAFRIHTSFGLQQDLLNRFKAVPGFFDGFFSTRMVSTTLTSMYKTKTAKTAVYATTAQQKCKCAHACACVCVCVSK